MTKGKITKLKEVEKEQDFNGEQQNKVIQECQDKLQEAIASEGFLIVITRRNGDDLKHYQARVNFRNDDVLPSINHVRELFRQELGKEYTNLEMRTFQ